MSSSHEHILFLTGKLAEPSLRKVLASMAPAPFSFEVRNIGISVAGLMTAEMIRRRVTDLAGAQRVMVPGRCRGDLDALSSHFGTPFVRGPEELKDIPEYFGRKKKRVALDRYDVTIFAEIVDAPQLCVDAIVARAQRYQRDGANVIDLGCLPDTPFPHLDDAISALKSLGFKVSVDSVQPDELLRGGKAGADYLLSLKEETLHIADEVDAIPVLIPAQSGDLASLTRAVEAMQARGKPFIADSILDPIHFGFTQSIVRYQQLRQRFPDIEIMMGVGNLTELTDADTSGINAVLMGIVSELGIRAILTTEVSPHGRRAVREADLARRVMFAAREAGSLPRDYAAGLLTVHDRKPFPDSPQEIEAIAQSVKDPSFRVQVSEAGIHVYNRDGSHLAQDPFELWPSLKLDHDGGHAFYLGVELARAQIAWQLGKRCAQDQELDWGVAHEKQTEDLSRQKEAGTTMHAGRKVKS